MLLWQKVCVDASVSQIVYSHMKLFPLEFLQFCVYLCYMLHTCCINVVLSVAYLKNKRYLNTHTHTWPHSTKNPPFPTQKCERFYKTTIKFSFKIHISTQFSINIKNNRTSKARETKNSEKQKKSTEYE